jgi:drug/metabolite transporter (DMT)-like permease
LLALRLDRVGRRFWLGAAVSFLGVALVGIGGQRELHGGTTGILLGIATAATWAGYSVAIAPLMRRYSPTRISALVLGAGWIAISLTGARQTAAQDLSLGWDVWALLAFATLGPLVLTNLLWFRALHRIGAARATLAANLNPFIAAIIALLLLSEPVTMLQVAGGVLIAAGIVVARRPARREPVQATAWTPAARRRRLRPWAADAGERTRGS